MNCEKKYVALSASFIGSLALNCVNEHELLLNRPDTCTF